MKNRFEPPDRKARWLKDRTALYDLSCNLDILRFESPVDCLEQAKTLYSVAEASKNKEATALLSVHVADCLRHLGRYHESAEACLHAVKTLAAYKESFSFVRALNSLGSVEGSLGNTSDALKHSLLALQLADAAGHRTIAAKCCITLSFLYCTLAEYESSLQYCLRVEEEDCDLSMQTVLCINWSEALNHLERYPESLEVIDRGLALVKLLPDRKFHAILLTNKSCILASIGRDDEAAELSSLAEAYFREGGYAAHISLPSKDLGARYLDLKNFEKGIQYLERSVELSRESERHFVLLDLNEMLAECYKGLGRSDDAFRILKSSLTYYKKQYADQVIISGESRANEQLEWIRREYDLLQEANSEMLKAKQSVEESNRRKTELLANISHEIRTPMNGVIGLAKKLAGTPLDADQLSTVRNITKCGENLLNIVDEVISLTEIESGNLRIENYEFDFRTFLSEIEMLFQPLCAEKNLTYRCDVANEISTVVLGDASRIRQVIINFIGNAVKFTDSGSITLSAITVANEVKTQRVRISVSDTGVGISVESQRAILLGESSRYSLNSRKFGGNGLGLTISRNIITALGGVFGLTSELNVGSTFWFEMDLPAALERSDIDRHATVSDEQLIADKPLTGLRILVAEDNIINWMVIESLLAQLGATVSRASDGEEAVRLEANSEFDVILMDCHMPKVSGYQASMQIREREASTGSRKLILALSADVMGANKELCRECGMDGFLAKPISTSDLIQQIMGFRKSGSN